MLKRIALALLSAIVIVVALTAAGHDKVTEDATVLPVGHPAIQYATGPLNDPVTKLDQRSRVREGHTRI